MCHVAGTTAIMLSCQRVGMASFFAGLGMGCAFDLAWLSQTSSMISLNLAGEFLAVRCPPPCPQSFLPSCGLFRRHSIPRISHLPSLSSIPCSLAPMSFPLCLTCLTPRFPHTPSSCLLLPLSHRPPPYIRIGLI